MNLTEKMIKEVKRLNDESLETGEEIINTGSILVDAIQKNCNVYNFPVDGIFNIWKESTDKKSVEKLFYELVGMEFDRYLMKCKEEITRDKN